MQFNGLPVYGTNSPPFMDQLALVRLDETISTVEAVNGGSRRYGGEESRQALT